MEQRCSLGVYVSEGAHSPSLGIKKDGVSGHCTWQNTRVSQRETGKGQQVSVESSEGRILTGKKLRFSLTSSHGTESLTELQQGIPEPGRWAAGV